MKQMRKTVIILLLTIFAVMQYGSKDVYAEKNKLSKATQEIYLKYDDRYKFKKEIKKIKSLHISSKNVQTGKKDSQVIKKCGKSKKVIAVGCGVARIVFKDNTKAYINVVPAKISLLLLIGQSNMEGSPSDLLKLSDYQNEYIINSTGQVYSTYGPSSKGHAVKNGCFSKKASVLNVYNASDFVPSSLTDNTSKYPWKRTNNLTTAKHAAGKMGMDGALAKQWVKRTGEKVWLVNAAHSGTSINKWLPDKSSKNNFWQAVNLYKECEKLLNKEIEAGHYKLSHKGYFWLQGEADKTMSASKYLKKYMKMHNALKKEMSGDLSADFRYVKKEIEFAGIFIVRANQKPVSLKDLKMTGPRKAQYYMCQSSLSKYKDIYMASQLSEVFATDKGVANYFIDKYGNEQNYNASNKMKKQNVAMPCRVTDVHSTVHYSQLAYNELGYDAVDNICYAKGYAKAPDSEVTIKLVSEDGYKNVDVISSISDNNKTIIAKIFPTWKSNQLYTMTSNTNISYNKWCVEIDNIELLNYKLAFMVDNKVNVLNLTLTGF